MSSNLGFNIQQ